MTVGSTLYVSVANPTANFGTLTVADLRAGHKDLNAGTVTYAGNIAHSAYVTPASAMFGYTPGATATKPEGDVRVCFGGPPCTAFPGTAKLKAGAVLYLGQGIAARATTTNVTYRLAVAWTDKPGTYTLGINYTIVPYP